MGWELFVETTLTPNLILNHNLRNIARVVPRGSRNPAALLVAGDAADTAFDYYRRLRQLSPAPFSAFACYDGWALASASPERFLACTDGDIESRPIKGTRPRGATLLMINNNFITFEKA